MTIKVYYCLPGDNHEINSIDIQDGTTIDNFLTNVLEFDIETEVGVYGKLVNKNYVIKDNDRIEIYEKIMVDPKIKRRKSAFDEKY